MVSLKKTKSLIISIGLFIIFVVFTILLKFVDVKSIGPNDSKVGFAFLNGHFQMLIGYNRALYKITEVLGIVSLLIVLVYGLIGLIELVRTKSFKKVDKNLYKLLGFYIVVLIFYVFFEKVVVNYRPVLLITNDYLLEPSYPSSHTILSLCVCGSAIIINKNLYKKYSFLKIVSIISLVLMLLIPIGRLFSGVHWLTDIIGGILLSSSLLAGFYYVIKM